MLAVQASETEVAATLDGLSQAVAIAAINGPSSVVISGDRDAVQEMNSYWKSQGRKTRRLRVSHAFHSPHMDGMLEDFRRVASGLSYALPAIPLISNLTGDVADPAEICTAEYWVRHVRQPVRFHDGIAAARDRGAAVYLELGPDAVLMPMIDACLPEPAALIPM